MTEGDQHRLKHLLICTYLPWSCNVKCILNEMTYENHLHCYDVCSRSAVYIFAKFVIAINIQFGMRHQVELVSRLSSQA